jgi:GxxExxY protein
MTERDECRQTARLFPPDRYPLQPLTGAVIESAFSTFRSLGYGFFESVYRRAMIVELEYRRVPVAKEVSYEVLHRGVAVGFYRADLVVDSKIIVEIKTGAVLDRIARVQLRNYLSAANLTLGLLIHFGPRGAKATRVIAGPSVGGSA